jgi:hypothetical protein
MVEESVGLESRTIENKRIETKTVERTTSEDSGEDSGEVLTKCLQNSNATNGFLSKSSSVPVKIAKG